MDAPAQVEAKTDPAAALMSAEAIARFFPSEATPTTQPPAAPTEATSTEQAAPSDGTKAAPDTAGAKDVKETPPPAPDAELATDDLSETDRASYAQVLQKAMRSLPNEERALMRKELDRGYLRQSAFTQKTQGIADVERDAEAFRTAMKDARLRKAWSDILNNPEAGETASAATDESEIEALNNAVLAGDGKALAAILAKRDERNLAKAEDRFKHFYEETAVKPVERFRNVETMLQAYADEHGIDYAVMRTAIGKAQAYNGGVNGPVHSWDPAKASDLVTPFLNGHAPKATTNTPAAASSVRPPIPKVAPPGRGSGAAAPAPLPAHRREGRPPKSDSEQAEEMAHLLSQTLGREISVADLENAR